MNPRFTRLVAQATAILVFGLSTAGPISAVNHTHHGGTDHGAVHSTLECIWMCAASSFVGTEGNHLNVSLTVADNIGGEPTLLLLGDLPQNFRPRAPPVFF